VAIVDATSGVSIYYTTDGSTPSSTNGTLYTNPFTLTATSTSPTFTLKAVATLSGYADSSVASADYTIYSIGFTIGHILQGMVNMPYSLDVTNGFTFEFLNSYGGLSTYSYSNLPDGIEASPSSSTSTSTSTLVGTPTASGSTSVTLTMHDATTNWGQVTFNLPVVAEAVANSTNTGYFTGQYACYVSDTAGSGVTVGSETFYQSGSVFSITAKGGSITAGEIDSNSPSAGYENATTNGALTGNYAVGSDNRGYLLLTTGGSTKYFALVGGDIQSGSFSTIALTDMSNTGSSSSSSNYGSGLCYKQNASSLSGTTGAYVFALRGEDSKGDKQAAVGQLSIGSSASAGEEDIVDNNTVPTHSTFTGSVTSAADSSGRVTITTGTSNALVGYLTNDTTGHVFFMSTTPHNATGNAGFLIGEARAQASSITSGSYPLTGPAVQYVSGSEYAESYGRWPTSEIDQITGTSSGEFITHASTYSDIGGLEYSASTTQWPYTAVDSYGRSIVTLGSSYSNYNYNYNYLYFYGANAAAVLFSADGSSTVVSNMTGWIEPQTASGTWNVSSLATNYFVRAAYTGFDIIYGSANSGILDVATSGALSSFTTDTNNILYGPDWDEGLGSNTEAVALDTTLDPNGAYGIFDMNLTADGVTSLSQRCTAISVNSATTSTTKGKVVCLTDDYFGGLMIDQE
jgi:hypothetical protein